MQEASGSWNWWVVFFVAMIVLLSLSFAFADPPPPMQPDPISIDTLSPSGPYGFGYSTNNIYGEAIGGGTGGADVVGGTGPVLHVFCGNFGVGPLWAPGSGNNVDGISNNEIPAEQHVIYFSGDDQSVGVPGTHYNHQAVRKQAAGDRFVTNGFTSWNVPAMLLGGLGPAMINGPVLPGPLNMLSANQTRYNEIPTISPMQTNTYVPPTANLTTMDDMDALEITPLDLNGDQAQDMPLYFTLDAASPDLMTRHGGATGGTILAAPPYAPPMGLSIVYAPFNMLGLTPQDEIDALAVWDFNNDLQAAPGMDYAIFSLAPGSPTLAQMGWSPADVLATGFMGNSLLYVPAAALGMLPTDNIDGLDVEPFAGPGSVEIWDEIIEDFAEADFEEDGDVDEFDLARWQVGYGIGTSHPEGDADGDGDVDGRDFLIWQRQFGSTVALNASMSVPEPTARALTCSTLLIVLIIGGKQNRLHDSL